MFKNILVATDLEQGSENVIRSVVALEGCPAERVLLLHVLDERLTHPERSEYDKKEKLKEQTDLLREKGFKVESQMVRGVPFDEIIHRAEQWKATVIVLGPGKAPAWVSSWMGSTTLRVLELCPLPVMTSPANLSYAGSSREVMMAMDFSDYAIHAYEELLNVLRDRPGLFEKVTLVHVHEKKNVDLLLKVVGEDLIDALVEIESSRLERMANEAREAGVNSVGILMETGRPVDQLLEIIGRERPSMIVLGAQGQGASDKYRIGKAVYRLSHMAPCRVLVVPLVLKGFPL